MTEQLSDYQRLKELAAGNSKIDAFIMHYLSSASDPDQVIVPMLMRVRSDSQVDWRQYAEIGGRIGDILVVYATPAQIIELLKEPDVINLEGSPPGGSFDSAAKTR